MTVEQFDYRDGDTVLQAGVVFPAGDGPAPAVLIAHQWAGRGEGEHKTAERLAELGYVGIAIDMFGKDVKGDPSGDNSHLIGPFLSDRAKLLQRMRAAVAFAASLDRVEASKIAAIGYCFGGLCVLDLARGGADGVVGVVSLHGMLDGNDLSTDGPIAAKVLVEHGWLDPLAAPDKVLAFAEEMGGRGADWQLHAHGRAMHAFTNPHAAAPDKGMAYDADADRRSWASVVAFLGELF
ncbi:dienelactone hydrolase family protein [Sphingomonas sp. SAFR-052]|uniref:dienelactone hydrolase family protein n=1 Tax=Sphingomonas sp. SAFR-052 TaxID=3436867 RepID=UPI003F7FDC8E